MSNILKLVEQALAEKHRGNSIKFQDLIQKECSKSAGTIKEIFRLGLNCATQGKLNDAEQIFNLLISFDPTDYKSYYNLGIIFSLRGNPKKALEFYEIAHNLNEEDLEIQVNRTSTLIELKQFDTAMPLIEEILRRDIRNCPSWINKGVAQSNLGHFNLALIAYKHALDIEPDSAIAISNTCTLLIQLRRYEELLELVDKSNATLLNNFVVLNSRAIALHFFGRYEEAINSYDKVLLIQPKNIDALMNKSFILLNELRRYEEAINSYDKALLIKPDYYEAWLNKGFALNELRRYEEAINSYDKALLIKPDYYEAWVNKGFALNELRRYEEAINSYDKALLIKPDYYEAWVNKGAAYNQMALYPEALWAYSYALKLNPNGNFILGMIIHLKMLMCDWGEIENLIKLTEDGNRAGKKIIEPFSYQAIATNEKSMLGVAKIYSETCHPRKLFIENENRPTNKKIRIGYISGEIRDHATAYLMVELFELHNKNIFEIYIFDNGYDDGSEVRARIVSACHSIESISLQTDFEVAQRISLLEIDILVDLNGYFGARRTGVFSFKPAPVQVSYLGYPGTLGSDYIDYLIADRIVVPEISKEFYTEKIAYLPNSYQVNDRRRRISSIQLTRAMEGLPEQGFVFCCFNNSYKITPNIFEGWMRIMHQVENSIIWLLNSNLSATENLKKEAEKRGISGSRIIFASKKSLDLHLARHQLANLFLDTLPINAHTTASDALWAGLPVLTMRGPTFSGRVAASLLEALGLHELIVETQDEYEEMAVRLATSPKLLAKLKEKLSPAALLEQPLFNTPLTVKNIEELYKKMYQRSRDGLLPDHLYI